MTLKTRVTAAAVLSLAVGGLSACDLEAGEPMGIVSSSPAASPSASSASTPTATATTSAAAPSTSLTPSKTALAQPATPSYSFDPAIGSAVVTKKGFGKFWPLTVASGIVNCIKQGDGSVAVIFNSDRSTTNRADAYAVNGTAQAPSIMKAFQLKPIDSIWADDPEIPGAKKDISVLIDVCSPYM